MRRNLIIIMPIQFQTLCLESTLNAAWNTVKSKGSAGGIDGVTIEEFTKDKVNQLTELREQLLTQTWKPQPYLQFAVPKRKDPNEKRTLGMAVVRDKIVQQAIRKIIEPRFERLFLPNSYAYRPGKGALKTIKFLVKQCGNKDLKYALRLDVDNFFDEIDHSILQQRLTAIGVEAELIRLIMLSIKIGRVQKDSGIWTEPTKGVPQGAVLSPLLANLYLHSFDQEMSPTPDMLMTHAFYVKRLNRPLRYRTRQKNICQRNCYLHLMSLLFPPYPTASIFLE